MGLNPQDCFYQLLLHDGHSKNQWEYSYRFKCHFQAFAACKFWIIFHNRVIPSWMPNFDTKWWVLFPPLQTVLSNTVRYWKKLRGFKADLIHLINPWEAPPTSNCCFKASLRSTVSEVIHEHLNQSLASVPEVFQIANIHLLLQLSVSISFISLSEK